MNWIFLAIITLAYSSPDQTYQLPIAAVTTINAQSPRSLIAGNAQGLLVVVEQLRESRILEDKHHHQIILIQRYQHNHLKQYVTVDCTGLLVIWNSDMSQSIHQQRLPNNPPNLLTSTATKELGPRSFKGKDSLIAVSDGMRVYEYSLNSRHLKRIINGPSDGLMTSLTYIDDCLLASVPQKGLYIVDLDDKHLVQLQPSANTLTMINSHDEDRGSIGGGIGLESGRFILHFDRNGLGDVKIQLNDSAAVSSLSECKSRERMQREDLIVVRYEDGTLQVRGLYQVYQKHNTNREIVAIVCQQDDIYYVDARSNIFKIQLDHLDHSRTHISGVGSLSLALMLLLVVGYQLRKRWQERRWKEVEGPLTMDIEMKERRNYEAPLLSSQL